MQIVGLLVGLFVAAAAAENGWRVKQEYNFDIEGRSLTGIPQLKHQYSGVHFRGNLRVQSQQASLLVVALKNMTFTKVHANMAKGWWHPIPYTNDELKRFQDLPLTGHPFIVRMDNGKVARVVVDSRLPAWEINFVQAIAAHLQQNMEAKPESRRAKLDNQPQDVYTVMEDSIVGRCQVTYEISPLSKTLVNRENPEWVKLCRNRDYLEVTKTWNYTNCEHLAESSFGLPKVKGCTPGGNECGQFWSRSSVMRTVGCGERNDLMRLNAVSSSQILANLKLQPQDPEQTRPSSQASLGSYLNLTLNSVHAISKQISPPTSGVAIDGIKYQYEPFASAEGDDADAKANPRKPRSLKRKLSKKKSGQHAASQEDSDDEFSNDKSGSVDDKKKQRQNKKKSTTEAPESDGSVEWSTPRPSTSSEDRSSDESHDESPKNSNKKNKSKSPARKDSSSADEYQQEQSLDLPPVLPFSPFALAHQDDKARACLVQQFKEMVQDITKLLGPEGSEVEKMEKIQLVVQMCRSMSFNDLTSAVNHVIEDRMDKTALSTKRKLLRDVVLMCGTNPAFLLIKNWVETGVLQGEEGAQVVAALPSYMLKPSRKLLQKFFDLVKDTQDQRVRIASVIAFSHLVRITCADQQKQRVYTKECEPQVKTYLSYLNDKAKNAKQFRPVFMTALGNTGFVEALPMLSALARDPKATNYQRSSAVVAMRHLVLAEPFESSKVLQQIYKTSTNPDSVRVAALSLLFYSKPSLATWQRIAVSTWHESSMGVKTFIFSSLRSFAANTDPGYKQMTKYAASVLPLVKVVSLGPFRPYNMVYTMLGKDVGQVISEQQSWTVDPTALNYYHRQTQRIAGITNIQHESDWWTSDLDGLMILMRNLFLRPQSPATFRPNIPNLPLTTRWIRDTLNIAKRVLPHIEGHYSFKLGNLHQRFMPYDSKSLPYFQQDMMKYFFNFEFGKEVLHQKMGHQSLWISTVTEIGFPAEFKIEIPWMIRAKSLIDSHLSRGVFGTQVEALASTEYTSELSVFTPHDCMRYVAGVSSFTTLQLPQINLAVQKLPGARLNVSFTPIKEDVETLLFSQNSTPYTAQQDMLSLLPLSTSNIAARIKIDTDIKSRAVSGGSDNFRLEYSSEAPNHRWAPEPNLLLNYPSLWHGVEASALKVWANRPSPFAAVLSIRHAKMENGQMTILNSTWGRPQRKPDTPSTTTPSGDSTTTPVYSSTTTPVYSSTTEGDTSFSNSEEGQPDNYTKMERLDRIKLKIMSANVEDPLGSFNASQLNLWGQQGDVVAREEYLFKNILSAMESGQAIALSAAVAVNHSDVAQYQSYFVLSHGAALEYYRVGAFFIDEVEKYEAAISGVVSSPKVPRLKLKTMLEAKINSTLMMDMRFSSKTNDDIVSLKGHVSRTESQKDYINNHASYRDCIKPGFSVQPQCYRLLEKAAFLDRYNLTINYNDGARRHGLMAQHYFGIAKHILFPHLAGEEFSPDVTPAQAPEKMIKVIAEVHPQTRSASLWMRTPTEETEFNNIPLNHFTYHTFRLNPIIGFGAPYRDIAYCSMEQKKVVTFDKSRFNYKLGPNWHVMAKDCSGRSVFAILVRNVSNHTEVMVNLDNYKIIHLMPGAALVDGYRVDLNREQLAETYDLAGTKIFELTYTSDKAFKLQLPAHGLTVVYDQTAFYIQPAALMRGRMCGICGNFNDQMEDDFSIPNGSLKQDATEFAKSWSLPNK